MSSLKKQQLQQVLQWMGLSQQGNKRELETRIGKQLLQESKKKQRGGDYGSLFTKDHYYTFTFNGNDDVKITLLYVGKDKKGYYHFVYYDSSIYFEQQGLKTVILKRQQADNYISKFAQGYYALNYNGSHGSSGDDMTNLIQNIPFREIPEIPRVESFSPGTLRTLTRAWSSRSLLRSQSRT